MNIIAIKTNAAISVLTMPMRYKRIKIWALMPRLLHSRKCKTGKEMTPGHIQGWYHEYYFASPAVNFMALNSLILDSIHYQFNSHADATMADSNMFVVLDHHLQIDVYGYDFKSRQMNVTTDDAIISHDRSQTGNTSVFLSVICFDLLPEKLLCPMKCHLNPVIVMMLWRLKFRILSWITMLLSTYVRITVCQSSIFPWSSRVQPVNSLCM